MNQAKIRTEQNKAIARQVNEELWGKGNLAVIEELCTADYIHYHPSLPNEPKALRGHEAFKQLVRETHRVLADFHTQTDDLIAEGNRVVTRWTSRGVQTGPWFTMRPAGTWVTCSGVTIDRIVDGKLAETWTYWEFVGAEQPRDVVATPELVQPEIPQPSTGIQARTRALLRQCVRLCYAQFRIFGPAPLPV